MYTPGAHLSATPVTVVELLGVCGLMLASS
jgi:hypothetical protein